MLYILSMITQGLSLGFTAAVSPGPFLVYTITETLARGWRHSWPIILAPLISDGPIIILTLFVLGQLPPPVIRAIQIFGGLFILYLAWGTFSKLRRGDEIQLAEAEQAERTGSSGDAAPGSVPVKFRSPIWRGVLINATSPGTWIFWSTINGPIIIEALRQSPAGALAYLVSFYAILLGGIAVLVAIFHQARRLDEHVVRGLLAASVAIMAGFGLLLLKSGLLG